MRVRNFALLALGLTEACISARVQGDGRYASLGCGSAEEAADRLEGARVFLFPNPVEEAHLLETSAELRREFYPMLGTDDMLGQVTDSAECHRVLEALAEHAPNIAAHLRAPGDTLREGLRFAILRIGPYYHVAISSIPLPGYIVVDGAFSLVAPRRTLKFHPVAHQQF